MAEDKDIKNGTNGKNGKPKAEPEAKAAPVAEVIKSNMKLYMISAGALLLVICLFFGMIIIHNHNEAEAERLRKIAEKRAEEERISKEKLEKERQEEIERKARELEEKWQKVLASKQEAMKNPALITTAITNFKAIKSSMSGTEYAKKADAEITELEAFRKKTIDQILADLDAKTAELVKNKEFEKAADIYKGYSGPLVQETVEARLKTAEKLIASAQAIADAQKQFQNSKVELLRNITGMIIKNKIADAISSYTEFTTKNSGEKLEDIIPVKKILDTIQAPEKSFLESCKGDIGGKVTVKMDGPFETVEISRIKEDIVYVKKAMGATTIETKINLANLSPEEKIRRAGKMDSSSKAVYTAVLEAEMGNYDAAEKALEPGGLLTEYLAEKIKAMKKDAEDKKAAEAVKVAAPKEDNTPKEFVFAPQHITIKADANTKNTNRQTLLDVYVLQDISLKVSVSNNASVDYNGKIEIYIIGDNTADKHIWQILAVEKKDLSIKKKETADMEVRASTEFNKLSMNKYGAEYGGYLIVIKDKADKVFNSKTNKATIMKIYDKIAKMGESDEFDERTGDAAKGVPPPRRRD